MAIGCIDDLRRKIVPLMERFPAPWCVAGGWAIDLFLNNLTRSHDDIELAIYRQDQLLLHHHLREWQFEKVVNSRSVLWTEDEHLELPVHEIHALRDGASPLAIEFLLNERDDCHWLYRRNKSIRLPIDRAIVRSHDGLPLLASEIVLLFKSKSSRVKDNADFASALPALKTEQRTWLRQAIIINEPVHPWLGQLTAARGDAC